MVALFGTIPFVKSITLWFLVCLVGASLFAWTPASDQRIAQKGAALAPNDLRLLIEKYPESYRQGMTRAEAEEGGEAHHYFAATRSGKLRERIQSETDTAIGSLRTRQPLADVVERLGYLAHFVADANNPFHTANDDPRLEPSHADFEQFFETRMRRFPTVFYGLDNAFTPSTYFERAISRASHFYPLMSEEYFRFGVRRTADDFDDRSTAFGVASVCYSHAVTDLVNLYYYIWRQSGGDVRSENVMRQGTLVLNSSDQ
jgi:hypothetical protein